MLVRANSRATPDSTWRYLLNRMHSVCSFVSTMLYTHNELYTRAICAALLRVTKKWLNTLYRGMDHFPAASEPAPGQETTESEGCPWLGISCVKEPDSEVRWPTPSAPHPSLPAHPLLPQFLWDSWLEGRVFGVTENTVLLARGHSSIPAKEGDDLRGWSQTAECLHEGRLAFSPWAPGWLAYLCTIMSMRGNRRGKARQTWELFQYLTWECWGWQREDCSPRGSWGILLMAGTGRPQEEKTRSWRRKRAPAHVRQQGLGAGSCWMWEKSDNQI